jgi:hypothetical protein
MAAAHMVHGSHEAHRHSDGGGRDLVCGMSVAADAGYVKFHESRCYTICSKGCLENRVEPTAKPDCDTPVDQIVELGRKLGATSTPTWFLRNGQMYRGAMPMEQLLPLLDAAARH